MPFAVHVERFTLVQVNQTEVRVARGGSHPLCQAIPVTEIRARLRWRGAAAAGTAVTARLRVPGHRARAHAVRLGASAGARDVVFTPRTEHVRSEAFPAGRYVLELRRGARTVDHTSLRLTTSVAAC